MARIRTTPETYETITEDVISEFKLSIEYNSDGTVNQQNTRFGYFAQNRNSEGKILNTQGRSIAMENWPAALKTDIKALYTRILADAESQGLIGAGTDTDDLA